MSEATNQMMNVQWICSWFVPTLASKFRGFRGEKRTFSYPTFSWICQCIKISSTIFTSQAVNGESNCFTLMLSEKLGHQLAKVHSRKNTMWMCWLIIGKNPILHLILDGVHAKLSGIIGVCMNNENHVPVNIDNTIHACGHENTLNRKARKIKFHFLSFISEHELFIKGVRSYLLTCNTSHMANYKHQISY